ncbi:MULTISPECIES: ribbon-helix-helix domain-containing protein [Paraburkholderia]
MGIGFDVTRLYRGFCASRSYAYITDKNLSPRALQVPKLLWTPMLRTTYCNFNTDLLKLRQRSVRLNGIATCLRLEEIYWSIIEELAREESLTVGKLISRWAMEMDLAHESTWNFTGYVRVVCVVQLMRRADPARQMDLAQYPVVT